MYITPKTTIINNWLKYDRWFSDISFVEYEFIFNNGNITKGYMTTKSIGVIVTLFVSNLTLPIYTSYMKPG